MLSLCPDQDPPLPPPRRMLTCPREVAIAQSSVDIGEAPTRQLQSLSLTWALVEKVKPEKKPCKIRSFYPRVRRYFHEPLAGACSVSGKPTPEKPGVHRRGLVRCEAYGLTTTLYTRSMSSPYPLPLEPAVTGAASSPIRPHSLLTAVSQQGTPRIIYANRQMEAIYAGTEKVSTGLAKECRLLRTPPDPRLRFPPGQRRHYRQRSR